MEKLSQPFFAYSLTVSTHAPYEYDAHFPPLIKNSSVKYSQYINSLHYADYSIGKFIEYAKTKDFFKNTIFVFTADHSPHISKNEYYNQKIPFLLYAPQILAPRKSHAVVSHVDLQATLAQFMGYNETASFGKNVLTLKDNEGTAYFINGLDIGFVNDQNFLVRSPQTSSFIVFNHSSKSSKIEKVLNPDVNSYSHELKLALSYMQLSIDLLINNRVTP